MAASIGRNDFVECVDNINEEIYLKTRALYCIEDIFPDTVEGSCARHGETCAGFVVTLKGVDSEPDGFCSQRFIPIYKRNDDLFLKLSQPVDKSAFSIQTKTPEKIKVPEKVDS